jgi:ATP adenylyltransferase
MEYILGPKGHSCVFCDMAAAPVEAYREKLVLLVDDHSLVCLNKFPFAAGHLLVVPRRHVSDLAGLDDAEYEATMRLVRATVARIQKTLGAKGVNVGMNLGAAAGAGIEEHLHAHVVPRWPGDTNFMPVMTDIRVMPEYLDTTWQKLAPVFADLPGAHPAT